MPNKTLTLHLAKPDVADFDQILSDGAEDRLRQPTTLTFDFPDFAEGGKLYVFSSLSKAPPWLDDLRRELAFEATVTTRSACAVLVFRLDGRMFASTFAHGWMYLDEDNIEGDFGLRVAINALDDKKLKRLERANLGDALRGVALSPFQREFTSFGQDDALDLVRKISGAAREEASAESMSGSRSLKVSGEFNIRDLPEIAAEALSFYQSTDYQETSFKIIDSVAPIVDHRTAGLLDGLAVESIRNREESFELSLPGAYDDDNMAYRFCGPGLRGRYVDLLLRHYIDAMGDRLADITIETLREHKVAAVYEDGVHPELRMPIRSALVGSIIHDGGHYAINEGEWYRVDEQFKRSIDETFIGLVAEWDAPQAPLRKVYDGDDNGRYQDEASYNREVAAATGYLLLDADLLAIPGVQRSPFEVCDLLDIEGQRFIHVKKSSRRSSILSHFFKQGSNAAQSLGRFPAAWEALISKVRDQHGDETAMRLQASAARDQQWTVEYWIADAPRPDGTFNIPFFSKISLRDEVLNLRAMRYAVTLRFIGLEPDPI